MVTPAIVVLAGVGVADVGLAVGDVVEAEPPPPQAATPRSRAAATATTMRTAPGLPVRTSFHLAEETMLILLVHCVPLCCRTSLVELPTVCRRGPRLATPGRRRCVGGSRRPAAGAEAARGRCAGRGGHETTPRMRWERATGAAGAWVAAATRRVRTVSRSARARCPRSRPSGASEGTHGEGRWRGTRVRCPAGRRCGYRRSQVSRRAPWCAAVYGGRTDCASRLCRDRVQNVA